MKTHGFLSGTYLTLHPAERRDVMPFHVDSGLFLALFMTLSQTDLPPVINFMEAISVAQAQRVAELAFMGFLFFLHRNVMSAISVAQARRVTELAFMLFLFFLPRNVMSAISVAQVRRVVELAFMGFLLFLLRNVMNAISVAQACRVAELAFHDIFKG